MKHETPQRGTVLNVLLVAFVAATTVQLSHEGCHAVVSLALGARVETFHLMGIAHSWPAGAGAAWQEVTIAGSAAVFNIVVGFVMLWLFYRMILTDRPFLRLFVFFVSAYSWFMGFGYLFFDPIFAAPGSAGDWARVVMFFGGGWEVRSPVIVIGGAGIVAGYFWVGKAAMRFTAPSRNGVCRKDIGLLLCIYPYVAVNLIYTLFGAFHPLGWQGFLIIASQLWLGYSGFFWAYMINFVWSEPVAEPEHPTPVPAPGLNHSWLVMAALSFALSVVLLFVPA